jgi:hypothetical protein
MVSKSHTDPDSVRRATYTDELTGKADQELLYREDEARLVVEKADRKLSFPAGTLKIESTWGACDN